jgi:hypothetical protein
MEIKDTVLWDSIREVFVRITNRSFDGFNILHAPVYLVGGRVEKHRLFPF